MLLDMDVRLYCTVGLPRSGKTTMCKTIYQPAGYAVVNPDSFRLAIHGQRFLLTAEHFVWAAVYAAVDALLLAGNKVIVDATCIEKKYRDPWTARGARFLTMGTAKEECIRRATEINDTNIIPIIERMAAQCDWPDAIDGSNRGMVVTHG